MGRQLRAVAQSPFVRQRLTTFISRQRLADIEELARLVETGQLTPPLDRSFPLAEAPAAVDYLSTGHARGKIAVTV
jgi:NADPH:quinone reductase-like Zn-dependent oxidoreductase